jgi:hypothetical protein
MEEGGTLERLKAAAERVAALEEELRAEQERRNGLVCAARDEGASWRTISRAAGVSMSRCVTIVGGG